MLIARLFVSKAEIRVCRLASITAGMVGARVEVEFDSTWDGYTRTFVWSHNGVVRDDLTASGKIPAEVLADSGGMLKFGVYGTMDGEVLPTLWSVIGGVHAGVEPSGDESTDPALPVWAQLQEEMEALKQGDPDASGGYYTPTVSQPNSTTMEIAFTCSNDGMPAVEGTSIKLPAGPQGADGNSGVYTLADGETVDDAPEWANVVVDPDAEPSGIEMAATLDDGTVVTYTLYGEVVTE